MLVVVDTNVLVSALVGHGRPRRLVAELLQRHQIVTSRQMLAELVDVLSSEKFKEVQKSQVNSFLSVISSRVFLVTVKQTFKAISEDQDDDIVLSTAHAGKAAYIVSGDRHLLDLKRFDGIRIISVNEMLRLL